MSKGFQFRAYPSDSVAGVLLRWIGCQRFIYNAKVREERYYRAFARRFAAFAGQHAPLDQAYAHLVGDGNGSDEQDTTWLRQVPSPILRNGAAKFYSAYQRFFKGLARRPTIQGRHGRQSVWLTSEMFSFESEINQDTGEITGYRLLIGTRKFPCGELAFKVNRGPGGMPLRFDPPASIHVSVNAGRWHVSFSNEDAKDTKDSTIAPSAQETLDRLRSFSDAELAQRTVGLDRGVAIPLCASDGRAFELLAVQKERLAQKERSRKRWQRRAARRIKGSKNRRKANHRAARAALYAADVRENLAHQASNALVQDPSKLLFVSEALRVKNMTSSAAGTIDAPGKKVRQKRGLNRAILGSAWGLFHQYTRYKALAAGKLCIEVSPRHSSQECSACGHTHADNRLDQSRFVCQRCGHSDNADLNAARVIARRGVEAIVSGSYTLKQRKTLGSLRGKSAANPKCRKTCQEDLGHLGSERSEFTPVETKVRRSAPRRAMHRSQKQENSRVTEETPTTTPSSV